MNYQPPKVTIDLLEYNDLLEFKKTVNDDKFKMVAKKIILLLIKKNIDVRSLLHDLNHDGITFTLTGGHMNDFNESDIEIKFNL